MLQVLSHSWCKSILFPLALAASILGCDKQQAGSVSSQSMNSVMIGEVVSMKGADLTYGKHSHQGIALAIQEANASGGVRGRPIKLISVDSQDPSVDSTRTMKQLISHDGVVAVLGSVNSSDALTMAPLAQQSRTPFLATIATHLKVTKLGDYVFRTCLIDSFQGVAMARFAIENLKLKKIAILRDGKSEYSSGLAESFTSTVKKLGGEISSDEVYSAGDTDFKTQLSSIQSKNVEAVFVPGYYPDVSVIAKQARALGIQVPLLGSDGWDSPKLKELGGEALTGNYFTGYYSPENPTPQLRTFISKYQLVYGEDPDGHALMGYEGAQVLIDALKRAKAFNPNEIREALASTQDVTAVSGKISMSRDGDAIRSTVVLKIEQNGAVKFRAVIQP